MSCNFREVSAILGVVGCECGVFGAGSCNHCNMEREAFQNRKYKLLHIETVVPMAIGEERG